MPSGGCHRAMQESYSPHAPLSAAHRRRRLALIVEHNTWLRLTLTRLFEEVGFTVATASNGYGGLRLATDLWPNVVVIGSALPELSGPQLADELEKLRNPSGVGVQVILTSNLLSTASASQWPRNYGPADHSLAERVAVAVQ
jgi:CheY-like chemotaxis protein